MKKSVDYKWKIIKQGSGSSREVLKFMQKGNDYSKGVSQLVKKGVKSVGFITIRKTGNQKTGRFDNVHAQVLYFAKVIF